MISGDVSDVNLGTMTVISPKCVYRAENTGKLRGTVGHVTTHDTRHSLPRNKAGSLLSGVRITLTRGIAPLTCQL